MSEDWVKQIGRYKVLSELGRGSMGRVYLSLDPNIGRRVALKVFVPSKELDEGEQNELRRRFLLEARAAGRLHHPGIVAVYDAETDSQTGLSYMAMEWVKGRPLSHLLRDGPLPMARAVAIVSQVAVALDHAHEQELVHRDIKPANILVDNQDTAKITDFGIAKFVSLSNTLAGYVFGTPSYMSPEQVKNEEIDGRSDLFSLGVCLYQCLTGVVPFGGDSLASITFKVVSEDPPAPRSVNPSLPEGLSQVVEKALCKDPQGRYQSGKSFAAALHRMVSPERGAPETVPPEVHGGVAPTPMGTSVHHARTVSVPGGAQGGDEAAVATDGSGSSRELTGFKPDVPVAGPQPASLPRPRSRFLSSPGAWMAVVAALGLVTVLALVGWGGGEGTEAQGEAVATAEVETGADVGAEAAGRGEEAAPGRMGKQRPAAETAAPGDGAGDGAEGSSTLKISYKNRLRRGTLSVRLDGVDVWREELASGGVVGRLRGNDVGTVLDVAPGVHTIEVRVTGAAGNVNARNEIRARFDHGSTRELKATLGVRGKKLKLSWEG